MQLKLLGVGPKMCISDSETAFPVGSAWHRYVKSRPCRGLMQPPSEITRVNNDRDTKMGTLLLINLTHSLRIFDADPSDP